MVLFGSRIVKIYKKDILKLTVFTKFTFDHILALTYVQNINKMKTVKKP